MDADNVNCWAHMQHFKKPYKDIFFLKNLKIQLTLYGIKHIPYKYSLQAENTGSLNVIKENLIHINE